MLPHARNGQAEACPTRSVFRRGACFSLPFLLALCILPAQAVELHLQYGALERMIAEAVFTQDGRRYVYNDKSNKCNFAYLEKPQIRGADGRLRIRAKFTGRSALNVIGQCVGLGDAFTVVLTANPEYRNGNIVLTKVAAAGDGKTGIYIRKVCTILGASLERDFGRPAGLQARIARFPGARHPGDGRCARDSGRFRPGCEVMGMIAAGRANEAQIVLRRLPVVPGRCVTRGPGTGPALRSPSGGSEASQRQVAAR